MKHEMVKLVVPVKYYMSSSGKTYYAAIALHGIYIKGKSMTSYKDALIDLQKTIKEEMI